MSRPSGFRRFSALSALLLFLLGNNFCLVTGSAFAASARSATGMRVAARSESTPMHACCAAAAERARRGEEATRESTAPCCVAVAPVVAPGVVSHVVAPMTTPVILPVILELTETVDFARAVSVEAVLPPPARAATPAAGRAPPLL